MRRLNTLVMANKISQTSKSSELLTYEGIKNRLEQAMSIEDREFFSEYSIEKLLDQLACLGPFAASPGTFDAMAFSFCSDLDDPKLAQKLLSIAVKAGLLKEPENKRYSITEEVRSFFDWVLKGD